MKKRGGIREVVQPCGNPAVARPCGTEVMPNLHAGVVIEFVSTVINNRRGARTGIRNIEEKGRNGQERENLHCE